MPKGIDLTGEVYGDFTVIEMLHRRINGAMRTYCKCLDVIQKIDCFMTRNDHSLIGND